MHYVIFTDSSLFRSRYYNCPALTILVLLLALLELCLQLHLLKRPVINTYLSPLNCNPWCIYITTLVVLSSYFFKKKLHLTYLLGIAYGK